eukprot:COSAG05_NODE_29_length_29038_cov_1237.466985_3_plen_74_part_00
MLGFLIVWRAFVRQNAEEDLSDLREWMRNHALQNAREETGAAGAPDSSSGALVTTDAQPGADTSTITGGGRLS